MVEFRLKGKKHAHFLYSYYIIKTGNLSLAAKEKYHSFLNQFSIIIFYFWPQKKYIATFLLNYQWLFFTFGRKKKYHDILRKF